MPNTHNTLMRIEAMETPECFRRQAEVLPPILAPLIKQLRKQPPRTVITCGRGSSDHAGVFTRYLIETKLKVPTASATPSTLSVYGIETDLSDCLVLLFSQSGQSPDLVNYAEAAKRSGALVVGFINCADEAALSAHCDFVVPLYAGPENSVAATKSYLGCLFSALQLVAGWAEDHQLQADLLALPDQMEQAQALDWHQAVEALSDVNNMLVLGRGPSLGISNEVALKFKETCGLHAESFSAAEVIHGPLAMIKPDFPVLIFDQGDASSVSIHSAIERLLQAKARILLVAEQPSDHCIHLPTVKGLQPWCAMLAQVQTSYLMIEQLSCHRGYNPDMPSHIAKVTRTL